MIQTFMLDLSLVRVRDVMHAGVFTCSLDAPIVDVASIMAKRRVHAVVVRDPSKPGVVGVISDLDVVAAIAGGEEPTARQVAAMEPLAVSADESVTRAAQVMAEHGVSHLLVSDPANGHPIGVVSTLDIAAVYAPVIGE